MIDKFIYWMGALVLAAFIGHDAHAAGTVDQTRYTTLYSGSNFATSWVKSAQWAQACTELINFLQTKMPTGYKAENSSASSCAPVQLNPGGGYVGDLPRSTETRKWCDSGAQPDMSKPEGERCPAACATGVPSEENVTSGWKTGPDWNSAWAKKVIPDGGWSNQTYCKGGCAITPSGPPSMSQQNQAPSTNGYYRVHATGTFVTTGVSCTADASNQPPGPETEPKDPPPEKNRCPLGTKQTGTDSSGIPICVGDKKNNDPKKETKTTKTTNADGSTTETTTETTTNSDGSTTTKTTTKTTNADGSDGGTKESTNTSKTPDGKDGKSDSTDQHKNDLCKQNPTLTICKNSQISGECRAISCDGDAIQCAIARKQAEDSCKRKEDEDAVKASSYHQEGQKALSGDLSGLPDKNNAEQINIGNLDANGWMGGGSCLRDISVSTAVGSFVVPLSDACDVLEMFRYLFMFVASMVSFGILSRSFLGN